MREGLPSPQFPDAGRRAGGARTQGLHLGQGPLPTPAGGEVGSTGSVMASIAPRKAGLPGPVPIGEGAPSPQADGQGLLRWEL